MLATSSATPSVLTNPRYADYNDYIGVYIKEDNIKDNFKKEEIESKDRNLDLSYEQTRAEAEEAKEINRMEVHYNAEHGYSNFHGNGSNGQEIEIEDCSTDSEYSKASYNTEDYFNIHSSTDEARDSSTDDGSAASDNKNETGCDFGSEDGD